MSELVVYVALATVRWEYTDVVGVFDNMADARTRCERINEGRDDEPCYDFCIIEKWELGATAKFETVDNDFVDLNR